MGLLLLATMYNCMLGVNYLQDSLGFLGYLLCSDWSIQFSFVVCLNLRLIFLIWSTGFHSLVEVNQANLCQGRVWSRIRLPFDKEGQF